MLRFLLPSIALNLLLLCSGSFGGLVFETKAIETSLSESAPETVVRYPFRNTGGNTVRITSVRSDCSCTTSELAKQLYAPGEAGEVVVKFDIGTRHGPQKKAMIVATDDPAEPRQILTLIVAIPQVLTLSTDKLLWDAGEAPAAKTITITTPKNVAVSAVRGRAQSAALNVVVERAGPTEFRVHVTPVAGAKDVSSGLQLDAELGTGVIKRSVAFVRVR